MNVVLQNPYVNEKQTLRENLLGVSKDFSDAQLTEVLARAALNSDEITLDDKASVLSGG